METPSKILYCHCKYAQVVPKEVKETVLRALCDSGQEFEAVADLCEMAARKDPALARLAQGSGSLKIAACFPRAIKWLFHQAGTPLADAKTEILNMRVQSAGQVISALTGSAAGAPQNDQQPTATPVVSDAVPVTA